MLTLHQIKQRLEELEATVFGEDPPPVQAITPQEVAAICEEVFGWRLPYTEESEYLARLINIHFHVPLEEDH